MDMPATLRWSAQEHEHVERSSDWYWALGVAAVCLAVTAVLFHDTLFGLLIIIGAVTMALYAREPRPTHSFELSGRGIKIDDTLHHWDDIISFWIEEDNDAAPTLLVDTTKPLSPNLIIPLDQVDHTAVRELLLKHCSEVPMREPLPHKIMEALGF
jgi:hypothetical protein